MMEITKEFELDELIEIVSNEVKQNSSGMDTLIQFLEKDFSKDDIDLAIRLNSMIAFIDYIVMGENKFQSMVYYSKDKSHIACYFDEKKGYAVFLKKINLLKNFGEINLFDEKGGLSNAPCTINEAIISIAIHEVRHRLQKMKMVKIFTPKKLTGNKRINSFIKFRKLIFKYEKRAFIKERRKRRVIKKLLCDIEFDAYLIQDIYLAEIAGNVINLEKLYEIIFLEPIGLFNK